MLRQDQRQLFASETANCLPAECAGQLPCTPRWPVIASIAMHGVLLFLILSGGSGRPANVTDAGGGFLSAFEVGLATLPGASGQNTAPQAQGMPAESSLAQKQQPEPAIMPEDAIPLQVENPLKSEQQKSQQRTEQAQRPQQTATASETQGENDVRRGSDGGIANQHVAGSGLVALAVPDAMADGDGRPFGFSLGEVSVQPKVLKSVPVVYPVEARRRGITGQVIVRFHLDEKGTVSHLHIKSADPPEIFNRNALTSLRQWRFEPAKQNRKAVPVWVELPIEFDLR